MVIDTTTPLVFRVYFMNVVWRTPEINIEKVSVPSTMWLPNSQAFKIIWLKIRCLSYKLQILISGNAEWDTLIRHIAMMMFYSNNCWIFIFIYELEFICMSICEITTHKTISQLWRIDDWNECRWHIKSNWWQTLISPQNSSSTDSESRSDDTKNDERRHKVWWDTLVQNWTLILVTCVVRLLWINSMKELKLWSFDSRPYYLIVFTEDTLS